MSVKAGDDDDDNYERLLRLLEHYQQALNTLETSLSGDGHSFPFQLLTQHHPRPALPSDRLETPVELISVWAIDCLDKRYISKTFELIRAAPALSKSTCFTKHLKSLKLNPSAQFPQAVSILLATESAISFRELTGLMLDCEPLRGLVSQSTPYRVKVPKKPLIQPALAGEQSSKYWPLVEHDPSQLVLSGTMALNDRMLRREWRPQEMRWVLDELRATVELARRSRSRGELGVGCRVSSLGLEGAEGAVGKDGRLANPPLASSVDVRTSSAHPLQHAVIEAIHEVARLDRAQLRPPSSADEPGPYLLTNLVVFATHEPCLLCSMALLHSRIKHLFFLIRSPGSGGCGSVYNVHEQDGLNHKFFVWTLNPHFCSPNPTLGSPYLENHHFDA